MLKVVVTKPSDLELSCCVAQKPREKPQLLLGVFGLQFATRAKHLPLPIMPVTPYAFRALPLEQQLPLVWQEDALIAAKEEMLSLLRGGQNRPN